MTPQHADLLVVALLALGLVVGYRWHRRQVEEPPTIEPYFIPCMAESDHSLLCTRQHGHHGSHAAHGTGMRVLQAWPQHVTRTPLTERHRRRPRTAARNRDRGLAAGPRGIGVTAPTCHLCGGTFELGESAYADDTKRVDLSTGAVAVLTRYAHITCQDRRTRADAAH